MPLGPQKNVAKIIYIRQCQAIRGNYDVASLNTRRRSWVFRPFNQQAKRYVALTLIFAGQRTDSEAARWQGNSLSRVVQD